MIKLPLLVLFLLCSYCLFAQSATLPKVSNLGLITGNTIQKINGKAVPFASVTLHMLGNDTVVLLKTITDKNGSFEIDKIPFAMYRLSVAAAGFATYNIDSINIRAERFDFNLGDIALKPAASAELQEVVVYAEKPLIENKDGVITYNVGESALSNGSSTAELLKNMPLVSNDPSGKILLKGKEPKILIDDKPTDLTADQLKDLLESLPGSSIEKIEVMTNPPAQYATEQGGVINIVTKKGKIGFTGKTTLNGGTRGEGGLSNNIGYRTAKWSTNNIIGASVSRFTGNSSSTRQNFYADSSNYFITGSNWRNTNIRPSLRTQWDYEFNKQHSVQATYLFNFNWFDNNTTATFINYDKTYTPYKNSRRTNGSSGTGYTHNVNIAYTYKGKKVGELLRVFVILNKGKNDNDKDYYQLFATGGDSSQSQYFNTFSNSYQVKLSYDKPVFAKAFISAGASYQQAVYHNTLNTQFFSTAVNDFIINDNLSNDFKFYQQIFTARLGMNVVLPFGFKVVGGVQAENTAIRFLFQKGNSDNTDNKYWNWLPNITLRKEFDKTFNMSVVYRATIRRPGITELNPNTDYSDPYNVRFGNPTLQPSTADNYDFNCSWVKGRYYINTSLGYNKVKDVFYAIRTLLVNGKTQTTYQNIATRYEYESGIWGGYTFNKKIRCNGSVGYTYNQYSNAEKQLFRYRDGGSFYASANATFMPTNLFTIEANARYSNFADPQGRSRSNINTNFGVQRKLMNKRLVIGINIIDCFTPQQFMTYTYGKNFSIQNVSTTNTRNFRLSCSYQLNKLMQKSLLSNKQKADALKKVKA